jgi:glutamine synthetase
MRPGSRPGRLGSNRPQEGAHDPGRSPLLPTRLGEALDALEADRDLAAMLGEYFVASFLPYKRNEIERFERFVADWEFREYAHHL